MEGGSEETMTEGRTWRGEEGRKRNNQGKEGKKKASNNWVRKRGNEGVHRSKDGEEGRSDEEGKNRKKGGAMDMEVK